MKRFSFSQNYRPKAAIDITPLIDLVFLLVVFFMVTSSLGKQSSIFINLPQAEHGAEKEFSPIVISVNEDDEIFVNDQPVPLESLGEEVSGLEDGRTEKPILIRGDKSSSYQTIVTVMDTLRNHDITSFTLSTVGGN